MGMGLISQLVTLLDFDSTSLRHLRLGDVRLVGDFEGVILSST